MRIGASQILRWTTRVLVSRTAACIKDLPTYIMYRCATVLLDSFPRNFREVLTCTLDGYLFLFWRGDELQLYLYLAPTYTSGARDANLLFASTYCHRYGNGSRNLVREILRLLYSAAWWNRRKKALGDFAWLTTGAPGFLWTISYWLVPWHLIRIGSNNIDQVQLEELRYGAEAGGLTDLLE